MQKLKELKAYLAEKKSLAIAFSGGVDSALLLQIAYETKPENLKAIFIKSPLNTSKDLAIALRQAEEIGLELTVLSLDETEKRAIQKNDLLRCYHCKKYRFQEMIKYCQKENIPYLLEGSNLDDLKDYRPGLRAIEELKILSPLKEFGFSKKEIRALAKSYGLTVHNRPSEPCLATRFPTNVCLEKEEMQKIGLLEQEMKARLQIAVLRLRVHQELLRIEVLEEDFQKIFKHRQEILELLVPAGYRHISLDLAAYQKGNMNILEGN